jgi:hypothetical protein
MQLLTAPQLFQVHDEKFHARLQRTAKQPKEGNKNELKKLSILPDTTLLEPEIDITDMEEMDGINLLQEEDDILTDDKCNTVIYLQMVPGLDLPLNSDTSD